MHDTKWTGRRQWPCTGKESTLLYVNCEALETVRLNRQWTKCGKVTGSSLWWGG